MNPTHPNNLNTTFVFRMGNKLFKIIFKRVVCSQSLSHNQIDISLISFGLYKSYSSTVELRRLLSLDSEGVVFNLTDVGYSSPRKRQKKILKFLFGLETAIHPSLEMLIFQNGIDQLLNYFDNYQ